MQQRKPATGQPIVYLGPSLPLAEARELLRADYRPPVRRGDLPAYHAGPVVVIDGEFDQSLAVSPAELLCLLDRGVPVIGASSMGALRAVELGPFGMRGCGWVYESYLRGRITGDDEVALVYSPLDYCPATVPLVNVRFWLAAQQAAGRIDGRTARRLLQAARGLFYAERTADCLRREWARLIGQDTLRDLLAATGGIVSDVKAADARLALSQVAAGLDES